MDNSFSKPAADIFIPDGVTFERAVSRVTHMGIGAHQDDLELMALHGILHCFGQEDKWFMGVTVTDGAASPQTRNIRAFEQRKAAVVGEYAVCVQLMHKSDEIKNAPVAAAFDISRAILLACPKIIYTHNLADKHDTHVAVALRVIEAIRLLPASTRPEKLYGCEVWRGLDWLCDSDKVVFDVSEHPNIASALIGVYDSQIAGGKRYDGAALGRRRANATFLASHCADNINEAVFGIDMSAFITDENLGPADFIETHINGFKSDVLSRVNRYRKPDS